MSNIPLVSDVGMFTFWYPHIFAFIGENPKSMCDAFEIELKREETMADPVAIAKYILTRIMNEDTELAPFINKMVAMARLIRSKKILKECDMMAADFSIGEYDREDLDYPVRVYEATYFERNDSVDVEIKTDDILSTLVFIGKNVNKINKEFNLFAMGMDLGYTTSDRGLRLWNIMLEKPVSHLEIVNKISWLAEISKSDDVVSECKKIAAMCKFRRYSIGDLDNLIHSSRSVYYSDYQLVGTNASADAISIHNLKRKRAVPTDLSSL